MKWFLLSIVALLSLACSPSDQLLLWTDSKEVILASELFNASQSQYKILPLYKKDCQKALLTEKERVPTLVVGRSLREGDLWRRFSSLSPYLEEIPQIEGWLDRSLVEGGKVEKKLRFLPLSYDPSLVIFRKDLTVTLEVPHLITISEFKNASLRFNKPGEKDPTKLGFSPLWSESFLDAFFLLSGRVHNPSKTVAPEDLFPLEPFVFLKEWVFSNVGRTDTLSRSTAFSKRYRSIPDALLVRNGRIGFAFSSLSRFMSLPEQVRDDLNVALLSAWFKISVADTLYLGVPKKGKSQKERVRTFLRWLLSPVNQRRYLAMTALLQDQTFGFLGGLSSITSFNEAILDPYFPSLVPRLTAQNLALPPVASLEGTQERLPLLREYLSSGRLKPKDFHQKWESSWP